MGEVSAEVLRANILHLRGRIDDAAQNSGRDGSDVKLELAIKTRSAAECALAASTLVQLELPVLLGHNRVQEGRDSVEAIRAAVPGSDLRLIGPLQSNKINLALKIFDGLETIDTLKLARKLSEKLTENGRTWHALLQVNVSGEASKSGCLPEEATDLALEINELPGLELQGFMTIGLPGSDEKAVRAGYETLRHIRDNVTGQGAPGAVELSMGMSNDLEWAIAEGATIVRVGTAAFGPRH